MGKILRINKTSIQLLSFHEILINFKREISILTVEKLAHTTSAMCHRYEALRRAQHHLWASLAQNVHPQSNHVKTADKPKLRDILQIN